MSKKTYFPRSILFHITTRCLSVMVLSALIFICRTTLCFAGSNAVLLVNFPGIEESLDPAKCKWLPQRPSNKSTISETWAFTMDGHEQYLESIKKTFVAGNLIIIDVKPVYPYPYSSYDPVQEIAQSSYPPDISAMMERIAEEVSATIKAFHKNFPESLIMAQCAATGCEILKRVIDHDTTEITGMLFLIPTVATLNDDRFLTDLNETWNPETVVDIYIPEELLTMDLVSNIKLISSEKFSIIVIKDNMPKSLPSESHLESILRDPAKKKQYLEFIDEKFNEIEQSSSNTNANFSINDPLPPNSVFEFHKDDSTTDKRQTPFNTGTVIVVLLVMLCLGASAFLFFDKGHHSPPSPSTDPVKSSLSKTEAKEVVGRLRSSTDFQGQNTKLDIWVKIVGALYILEGIRCLFGAIRGISAPDPLLGGAGVLYFLIAIFSLGIGIGLMNFLPYARQWVILFTLLNLFRNLISVFMEGDHFGIVGIMFHVMVLWLFFQPDVVKRFSKV